MSRSIRNIILILTFVILMPVAIFTAIEVGSLNEDEEILEDVYRKQLDAIIFSINQYSSDLFNFYINQIDYQWRLSNNQTLIDSTFTQQNLAIEAIAVQLDSENNLISLRGSNYNQIDIDSIFQANQSSIERLIRYKETGYLKPEALGSLNQKFQRLNVSLVIIGKQTPCLIFMNPRLFIEDLLAPQIQQIANQKLDISVRHTPTDETIYAVGLDDAGISQTGELLLLKDFEISVSLQDRSIHDLIAFRSQKTIISFSLIILLIIVGAILVIKNLRKEIQLSKAKADFVANVSHEIRTPLSLISMFNETLLMDRVKDEEKKKEYYEIIDKETSRLKNIVSKILSFSQIDADQKKYDLVKVNANEIIEDVTNSYSYHLKSKGFELDIDLEETNQTIQADKEAFTEVLINLIDNAVKYSMDTKSIKISSKMKGTFFSVEVSDKGMGIKSKDQQKIFDKFYRVEGWETHNTKGTGLGLSLVNEIMKAHNGKINISSKPNEGSTFTLLFPIDQ